MGRSTKNVSLRCCTSRARGEQSDLRHGMRENSENFPAFRDVHAYTDK